MIIYLARHGQTEGDIENRYGGAYDDHITELGQQQAVQLAKELESEKIERLYATPLIRSQETASIVAPALGLGFDILSSFRERNSYGILTGLVKEEAAVQFPDQVELLGDINATVEGAEAYGSFQKRVLEGFRKLSEQEAQRVAVITHGGPISLVFRELLRMGEVKVSNCGWASIEVAKNEHNLLQKTGITSA